MEVRQSVNGLRELRVFEGIQERGDGMSDQMLDMMANALGYLVLVIIAIVILFGGVFVVLLISLGIKSIIKDLMDGEYEE